MTASEEPRMTARDMRRTVWLNNRPAPEERDRVLSVYPPSLWELHPKALQIAVVIAELFGTRKS